MKQTMYEQTMYDLVIQGDEGEPPTRQMYLSLKAAQAAQKKLKRGTARIEQVRGYVFQAPIDNSGVTSSDSSLAQPTSSDVRYVRNKKMGGRRGGGMATTVRDQASSSKEEHSVSKTSQKKVKPAAKKAAAKAKANTNGKSPREPKEKTPYVFKPLAKSFSGVAGKATMDGKILKHVPFHAVEDGKTACGYSTLEVSEGLTTYGLNWTAVDEKVTCGRCLRNLNKEKKPTPIKSAKKATKKSAPKKKVAAAANA